MPSILKDYYNTGSTDTSPFSGAGWRAQTFTAGSTYQLTSVKLLLYKTSASPGIITVSIRNTNPVSPRTPVTPDLVSNTTDGNTLPLYNIKSAPCTDGGSGKILVTSAAHGLANGETVIINGTTNYNGNYVITKVNDNSFTFVKTYVSNQTGGWAKAEWREITFSTQITLTSDIRYAIIVRGVTTGGNWRIHSITSTYPGGDYCTSNNGGSSWSVFSGYDVMFETWGAAVSIVSLIGSIDVLSGTGGELNGIFGFGLCNIVIQSSSSGLLNLLTSCKGSISSLLSMTGKLENVWVLAGSVAVESSVNGVLGLVNIIRTSTIKTYRRLTAVGNNQFWYEDI